MGERLAASNVAVAPLANTLATGRRARRAHPDVRPGPADAPGFIVAQLLGAAATTGLFRWLVPALPKSAPTS